jgi:hypothetical protein
MAGIDASIYGQIKPLQLERKENVLAEMAGLRAAENQNRLFDMQVAEKNRLLAADTAQRNAFRNSFDPATGKIDPMKRRQGLVELGDYKGLQQFETDQAAQAKTKRETEKAELESHLKRFEVAGQIMAGVKDQASWEVARQQTAQVFGSEAAAQMPAQYDPALIEQKRLQALTVKDQLEQKWKAMEYTTPNANTVANNKTSTENNKRTVGASYANAAATREIAKATKEAAGMQRDRDTEMKIADDYRAQSKPFKEVGDAYRQINATLDKAATSPAATLAAATKFMKLLDPGSVVRESELAMALQAEGVFDRAANYYNTLKLGKVLTPSQVVDFKSITKQIYRAAQEGQKAIDASYTQQAKTYGLRPEMIVQDLGQNVSQAGKSAPNSQTVFDEADAILKGL